MRCAECGGVMHDSTAPIKTLYRGQELEVLGVPHFECSNCGEYSFSPEGLDEYSAAIDAEYRKLFGLLSGAAIRNLRKQNGLTQRDLQKLVGVSDPTVSRWETGASPQSPTADKLMRVMLNVPGATEYLMAMEGMSQNEASVSGFDMQWNKELKDIETGNVEWKTAKA